MKVKPAFYTVYGEFFLKRREWFTLPEMVRLLKPLGFGEPAIRTALFRLLKEGQLEASDRARPRRYRLAPGAQEWLEAGVQRVHAQEEPLWDGLWRVISFSVPEDHRGVRDRLRRELVWLGFGALGGGTWVSPRPLLSTMLHRLAGLGLERVAAFEGRWAGGMSEAALVASAWNLDEVAERYRRFMAEELAPREAALGWEDAEAFRQWVTLVYEFRKFLHIDPGLPHPLLPEPWPGTEARRRLALWMARWRPAVERFLAWAQGQASGEPVLAWTGAEEMEGHR
ncbi:MAG: hypothetical protein K6U14_10600 [Firmicutes bacterium]|nr:hypothetical protein [Alicyclobacillaceae bacterium]MCL6498060.1 hypothetical protein [Bacillota bacterium]